MKPIHGKHIWELMQNNACVVSLLLLLITISMVLTGNIVKKQNESQKIVEKFEQDYGENHFYWMNEDFNDQVFYTYMEEENSIQYHALINLVNDLYNEKNFDYYTCNAQPFMMEGTAQDIFLFGYEGGDIEGEKFVQDGVDYSQVKVLQVSEKFFTCNHVKVKIGEEFTKEDYNYLENHEVPVLLGSAYQDVYRIGDVIEGNYISERMKLKVKGFLDVKTFYLSSGSNDFESLERHIILPAWIIPEKTEFSKIATLMLLNGNIQSKAGYASINKTVDQLFKKYNAHWKYNLKDPDRIGTDFAVKRYSKMTKQVAKQYNVLVILVVLFTVIALVINVFSILEKINIISAWNCYAVRV